jgi:hypothetical protein
MFRRRPDTGHGRIWNVLDRRLNGFMLVAPFPCGIVQADIRCEQATTSRAKLTTEDRRLWSDDVVAIA